jgi:hypothetical protein
MKNARRSVHVCCVLWLACLLVACQPDKGDLLPLAQDGAEISTAIVNGDTAQISRGNLVVKARGRWQALESATDFHLEVGNAGDKALTLDLTQAELVNAQGERLRSNVLIDEDAQTQPATLIKNGAVELAARQTRKLGLSFKSAAAVPAASAKDFLGKTATLYLPAENNQTAAPGFKFAFKYVENRY